MTRMTQPQMAEFDAETFRLMGEQWKAEHILSSYLSTAHYMAGDKKSGRGQRARWQMTDDMVLEAMEARAESGDHRDLQWGTRPSELLLRIEASRSEIEGYMRAVARREELWAQYRWTRYYPCQNDDGHIHSSLRACQTVRWDTKMGWATEMSGLTADQAIHGHDGKEGLGETLCSVCFPDAPPSWRRTRSEVTRAEREAAKAERQEAKYLKQLRPDEAALLHDAKPYGDRITTVNGCLEEIRTEVEFRDYYGRGEHPYHSQAERGAQKAIVVLLHRERTRPGTGKTQEQIDKVIASAVKANIKNGARLNKDGSLAY